MDRREALKRTFWIMGGIVSAPALSGILKGCQSKPALNWKPEYFNDQQAIIISDIANIMIPKTETPGAVEAGVPSFIDKLVKDCFSKEDQDKLQEQLKAFNEDAEKSMGEKFEDLDVEEQVKYVVNLHNDALKANDNQNGAQQERPFIMHMKELVTLGYFTSEPGATLVLQYEPVPGMYKGCIPLSEAGNGRTWA